MLSVRPTANPGRSTVGWLQMMRHRHRGVRWIAAAGAAAAAFVALSSDGANDRSASEIAPTAAQQSGPAARLPPLTRGVPVPVDGAAFAVGDIVDIHEIRTGGAVVRDALVVGVSDEEAVVAVPAEQVDALVDALTTGGVILVLVPRAGSAP